MRATPASLAEHPTPAAVEAVINRVPYLEDTELVGLAGAWRNTPRVAKARTRALDPDTPLVVDVLRAFDDVCMLYGDDLDGDAPYLGVDAATVSTALKAVRDAIAGVITRPTLGRRSARALLDPWNAVVSPRVPVVRRPARGVTQLAAAVADLGHRCHDARQASAFEHILLDAMTLDRDAHNGAVTAAFDTALATSQRRTWSLLRHRVELSLVAGSCRRCPPSPAFDAYDRERVSMLCADAVCGLLVAEELPGPVLDVLLQPLAGLVPFPRPPLSA